MNKIRNFLVLVMALAMASSAFGQLTTSQTTFSVAVGYSDKTVYLTSVTPNTGAQGVLGLNLGAFQTVIYVDKEAMGVVSVNGTAVVVQRGIDGTRQSAHTTGALVWFGAPTYFSLNADPAGTCIAANEVALPRFFELTGNGWTCPGAGPRNGQWTLQYPAPSTGLSVDNSQYGAPSALQVCHAQYNFAVDGGAVGLITPARNCVIPINALIWQAYSVNTVAPIGSTGNVSIGLSAGAGGAAALLAATARGSLTVGTIFQAPMVQTTASASNSAYVKMSAAGSVTVTVATNALTAGIIDVYVFYTVLPA